jgi:choline dehydrogenase-like flavoprotein
MDFDAIVVGSGITGGWAAKELTQAGLKVLMIERGREIRHQQDYDTETKAPWDMPFRGQGDTALYEREYPVQMLNRHFTEFTEGHFVNDAQNPYQTTDDTDFTWFRSYQLGGRSLTWGRQCYRWSDYDFGANARDGHGTDWPIRYADLAPWYDKVESFVGVSGAKEGLAQLPDGQFQPPMALNVVEQHTRAEIAKRWPERCLTIGRTANLTEGKPDEGRAPCQYRSICARGCSFGAYFSTQSSTLPAATATGNLTVITDAVVEAVDYDPATRRARGVRYFDTKTRTHKTASARLVFLNAGAFNSVHVLLNSANEAMPQGLANSSGVLGTHIMDHANTLSAAAIMPGSRGTPRSATARPGSSSRAIATWTAWMASATRAASRSRAARCKAPGPRASGWKAWARLQGHAAPPRPVAHGAGGLCRLRAARQQPPDARPQQDRRQRPAAAQDRIRIWRGRACRAGPGQGRSGRNAHGCRWPGDHGL